MPARPPLQVEVVTKIPVANGLGLADPGVTGGISRTVATAQSTAARAAVEVVTDVPGQLRNITPITLGQRAANLGKIGVQIGSKAVGVGLGVLGNLAQDLLFPDPVGVGSDMVGGVKIGSQPKPAPVTAPVTTQPIAQPQVKTAPFKPAIPKAAPVAAPTKPRSQTQTSTQTQVETQPLPFPEFPRPQSAPVIPRPNPVAAPAPRSALDISALPERKNQLNPDSPFPLNIVDITRYGGVNLTYPIAQELLKLPNKITAALQPGLDNLELRVTEKLNQLPPTFEQILQNALENARIETSVILPVATALSSQIPFQLDLSKQIPVATDLAAQIPLTVDLNSQIPLALGFTSQLPVAVDMKSEIPLTVAMSSQLPLEMGLISQLPLAVDLTSQIPFQMDLSKQIPVATDLTAQIPFQLDLSKQIPVATDLTAQIPFQIDLSKQIPITMDLTAALQPDSASSNLKSLQECCESIQNTLKKKAEMFEGRGELVCGEGTVPFAYRGEGLNGIHQLIKIVLGANQQILEKICNLNIEYPLIEGSGVYDCGTLPPTLYHYSGLGFLGIQNQVEQLFKLDKQILTEVCEISSSPFGSMSFPEISGQIEYFDCDAQTQTLLYSGNGLEGLSKQVDALSTLVKVGVKAACDSGATVIMPDARFEQFKASRQLQITWGTHYPTQKTPLWTTSLPDPIGGLDWCQHFESLQVTKGNIMGHVEWQNSKISTGIYCETEEEAKRILLYLITLSNTVPTLNRFGQPKVVITKGNSSKRIIEERTLRAVRVAISEIGEDGNVSSVQCFTPPPGGCLPTII